jgi:hypothetical protein
MLVYHLGDEQGRQKMTFKRLPMSNPIVLKLAPLSFVSCLTAALAVLLCIVPTRAQTKPITLAFESSEGLKPVNAKVEPVTYKGRKALRVTDVAPAGTSDDAILWRQGFCRQLQFAIAILAGGVGPGGGSDSPGLETSLHAPGDASTQEHCQGSDGTADGDSVVLDVAKWLRVFAVK